MKDINLSAKERRQHRVRIKMTGRSKRPRLTVFRSNRYIYAQIIDDTKGKTFVSATDSELKDLKDSKKTERAYMLGKLLAQKAKKRDVKEVIFDRGRFAYHGRVQALALGAREGGLKF